MKKVLDFTTQLISQTQDKELRSWLSNKESVLFREVIRGKVKEALIISTHYALEIGPTNSYSGKAAEFLAVAQRYQTLLDVFEEMVAHKDTFSVIVMK